MGSQDTGTKQPPHLTSIPSQNLNLCRAERVIEWLLSRLPSIGGPSGADESPDETVAGSRPSPSLVPLPITSDVSEPAKNACPVLSYCELLGRRRELSGGQREAGSGVCAVCMNCLEGSDHVRELRYCAHAFHRECVDAWIDQGRDTCPICRAKLWSKRTEEPRDGGDPWRAERMVYLFGADLEL